MSNGSVTSGGRIARFRKFPPKVKNLTVSATRILRGERSEPSVTRVRSHRTSPFPRWKVIVIIAVIVIVPVSKGFERGVGFFRVVGRFVVRYPALNNTRGFTGFQIDGQQNTMTTRKVE